MKQMFYWHDMKSSIRSFVESCLTCQRAKLDCARLPGLLQPLPMPASAWQIISLAAEADAKSAAPVATAAAG
jgi:hypothetical protein